MLFPVIFLVLPLRAQISVSRDLSLCCERGFAPQHSRLPVQQVPRKTCPSREPLELPPPWPGAAAEQQAEHLQRPGATEPPWVQGAETTGCVCQVCCSQLGEGEEWYRGDGDGSGDRDGNREAAAAAAGQDQCIQHSCRDAICPTLSPCHCQEIQPGRCHHLKGLKAKNPWHRRRTAPTHSIKYLQ